MIGLNLMLDMLYSLVYSHDLKVVSCMKIVLSCFYNWMSTLVGAAPLSIGDELSSLIMISWES